MPMAWCMCVGQVRDYLTGVGFLFPACGSLRSDTGFMPGTGIYLLSLPAGPQTAVFTIKHSNTVQFKDQLTDLLCVEEW